jgi:competence ComEA-like helix-hairpin-helix protein
MWTRLLALSLALCLFSAPYAAAKKKSPTQPININTASSDQLQQVPGIGPVTAQKILQMRRSYGAFNSVDDLMAIRGIGPKRLEKMRMYLTVGKPKSTNPEVAAKCSGCSKQKARAPGKSPAGQKTQPTQTPSEQSGAELEGS